MKQDIFKDQPSITLQDRELLRPYLANWKTINYWIKHQPRLSDLKKAAILESRGKRRMNIMARLVARIYKLEHAKTLKLLLK